MKPLYLLIPKTRNRFIAQGFPKEKIVLSYATTTSKAYADAAGATQLAAAPIGVRNGLFEGTYTPDKDVVLDSNGQYRFITGVNQTRNRSEFINENNLAGIFYWDMGNDVATSHIYSLPKASNFAISCNVDSLVTVVNLIPNGIFTATSNSKIQMRVYPNPVKDELSVLLPGNEILDSVRIFNSLGQCQLIITNSLSNRHISIKTLKAGYYILRAKTQNGSNYSCTFEISN